MPTLNRLWEFDHPDLSPFVVHFTHRAGRRGRGIPNDIYSLDGRDRLISILTAMRIYAFSMFQTDDPVVCFTECTVAGVEALVRPSWFQRYESPWGIAFRKDTIFRRGSGPALYVRGDAFDNVDALPAEIRAFCTRYWPGQEYSTEESDWVVQDPFLDTNSQWIIEREWRIRGDDDSPPGFSFSVDEIAFLVVMDDEVSIEIDDRCPHVATIPVVLIDETGKINDPTSVWVK